MSKQTTSTTITALKHADKRVNIPTEELRDFVVDDEQAPKSLRYPRDPSLDPQLVWRGKDEQDAQDLAVPSVPIYIQEKIHPQSIINDLLAQAAKPGSALREAAASYQLNLFADFNGGPEEFDQKVEFYQHEQNWANRLILGDSLLVMASLAEKEGLRGKVQTIYLDPPYGIKFGSNWQVSTRKRDVKDGKAEDATRQPEQVRAFRDTWKLGIHSYLAYLRDRLVVARDLLTETGSVFVQIGDENVHLVRCVLDEVFGSENFVSLITFSKTSSATTELLAGTCDYIILYAKDRQKVKYRQLFIDKAIDGEGASAYDKIELADGRRLRLTTALSSSLDLFNARHYRLSDMRSQRPPGDFPVTFQGKTIRPISGYWKTGQDGFQRLVNARRIELSGNTLNYVRYLSDFPAFPITNIWNDVGSSVGGDKVYVVQTGTKIIE
ncbi:MAG: DNA methyltransferase, partial [Anaerolineae bacterium]